MTFLDLPGIFLFWGLVIAAITSLPYLLAGLVACLIELGRFLEAVIGNE